MAGAGGESSERIFFANFPETVQYAVHLKLTPQALQCLREAQIQGLKTKLRFGAGDGVGHMKSQAMQGLLDTETHCWPFDGMLKHHVTAAYETLRLSGSHGMQGLTVGERTFPVTANKEEQLVDVLQVAKKAPMVIHKGRVYNKLFVQVCSHVSSCSVWPLSGGMPLCYWTLSGVSVCPDLGLSVPQ
jgi:hypothetical protein